MVSVAHRLQNPLRCERGRRSCLKRYDYVRTHHKTDIQRKQKDLPEIFPYGSSQYLEAGPEGPSLLAQKENIRRPYCETSLSKAPGAFKQSLRSIRPAQFGSAAGETQVMEFSGPAAFNVGEVWVSCLSVVVGLIAFPGTKKAVKTGEMKGVRSRR